MEKEQMSKAFHTPHEKAGIMRIVYKKTSDSW